MQQANEASIKNGLGRKVLACFHGHHQNADRMEDGIHYFVIIGVQIVADAGLRVPIFSGAT